MWGSVLTPGAALCGHTTPVLCSLHRARVIASPCLESQHGKSQRSNSSLFLKIIFPLFLNLKGSEFMAKQMLPGLLFATFGSSELRL